MQIIPTAVVLGSVVALAFGAWISWENKKIDGFLVFAVFFFFIPFLSLFFLLALAVLPRLA